MHRLKLPFRQKCFFYHLSFIFLSASIIWGQTKANVPVAKSSLTDTLKIISQDSSQSWLSPVSVDSIQTDSVQTPGTPPPEKQVRLIELRKPIKSFINSDINSSEYDQLIYRNLGNILSEIPTLFVEKWGRFGAPTLVRIQGSSIQQPRITIDGMPVTHSQSGPFNLNNLATHAFQSAEFTSTGNYHFGPGTVGTINLQTHVYDLSKPYSKILWHSNGSGESVVDVLFGQKVTQNTNFTSAVSFENRENSSGEVYDAQKIRNNIKSTISSNWHLNYNFFHNRGNSVLTRPNFSADFYPSFSGHLTNENYSHLLSLKGAVNSDSLEDVNLGVYFNSHYWEYRDENYDLNNSLNDRFGGVNIACYPFNQRNTQIGINFDVREINNTLNIDEMSYSQKMFVNDVFSFNPNFSFGFRLELESNSQFGIFFSPLVTLTSRLSDRAEISINAHHCRQLPGFFEMYLTNDYIFGNPSLDAETSNNFNLAHHFELITGLKFEGTSFFRNTSNSMETMVLPDTNNTITFLNSDEIFQFWGHDEQLIFQPSPIFRIKVSYGYIHKTSGNLINIPENRAAAHVSYAHNFFDNNLKSVFNLSFYYLDKRIGYYEGSYPYPYFYLSQTLIEQYREFYLNFKFTGTIRDVRLFFAFENILSRKYEIVYGYQMPKLTFMWGLDWNFWN